MSSMLARRSFDKNALYVSCGYILTSLLWIWATDWVVEQLAERGAPQAQVFQSLKGTFFVLVTGLALYTAIALANKRERRLAHEKRMIEEMLSVSQRLEGLGTLAGTLVHDFNNVLTVIRGETEIMRLDGFLANDVPSHVAAIELAAKRADLMVGELMLFMRNAPASFSFGDLGEVVDSHRGELRRAVGQTIQLETHIKQPLPTVAYDRSQIERALHNLVLNARDALIAAPVKRIDVAVAPRSLFQHRVLFSPEPISGDFLSITVADTGPGIPRDDHVRIFNPFFTTKGPGKGSGLGLTSVLRVMQAHRGWIEIESEPGKGARFILLFPVLSPATA